jgi:hypothetical protein
MVVNTAFKYRAGRRGNFSHARIISSEPKPSATFVPRPGILSRSIPGASFLTRADIIPGTGIKKSLGTRSSWKSVIVSSPTSSVTSYPISGGGAEGRVKSDNYPNSEVKKQLHINHIKRTAKMSMIYLCDSLSSRNVSTAKMKLKEKIRVNVKNIDLIQANVICEITIPGVKKYKSVQKKAIPKYPMKYILSKSPGK